jgi:hypothetical protein
MIDWLIANKTWVFDGFGVAIVVAIIGFICKRSGATTKLTQKQKGGANSINIQGKDIKIGDINRKDTRDD